MPAIAVLFDPSKGYSMQPLLLLDLLDRVHIPTWSVAGLAMGTCVAVAAAFYYRPAAPDTTHE